MNKDDLGFVKPICEDKYDGVLLYSGGLDSYITYYYLKVKRNINVLPVYFNISNSYSWFEEDHVMNLDEFKVFIDPSISLGELECIDYHIPMRNVILMIMAAIKYSPNVFIGSLYDDNSPDGNEQIFTKVCSLLNEVEGHAGYKYEYKVSAPLREDGIRKVQACKWFVDNINIAKILTKNTASCFSPLLNDDIHHYVTFEDGEEYKSNHCYSCQCCFRRNAALFGVGIELPFINRDMVDSYEKSFKEGHYDDIRADISLQYIEWLKTQKFY